MVSPGACFWALPWPRWPRPFGLFLYAFRLLWALLTLAAALFSDRSRTAATRLGGREVPPVPPPPAGAGGAVRGAEPIAVTGLGGESGVAHIGAALFPPRPELGTESRPPAPLGHAPASPNQPRRPGSGPIPAPDPRRAEAAFLLVLNEGLYLENLPLMAINEVHQRVEERGYLAMSEEAFDLELRTLTAAVFAARTRGVGRA